MGETKNQQTKLASEVDGMVKRAVMELEKAVALLDQVRFRLQEAPNDSLATGNSKNVDDLLRRIVRPVSVLTVMKKSNGGSYIILDDDQAITLSPSLTKLLLWIARDKATDGLPRYKSMDETTKALSLKKKHTLNQQIYRLRQLLQEHDRNQFLVETRNSQIRFLARDVIVRRAETPK